MKKIIKHSLDFDKVYPYFIKQISCGNALSQKVIKEIDFKKGIFFTFLPDNAVLERLYEFRFGGIIPLKYKDKLHYTQNTNMPFFPGYFTTMDRKLSSFIFKFLEKNKDLFVIMEDIVKKAEDKDIEIKGADLVFKNEDVLYVLKPNVSKYLIHKTISLITHVWHYLAVFTRGSYTSLELTEKNLNEICNTAEYIVTSAYDGEGYVYWQKQS